MDCSHTGGNWNGVWEKGELSQGGEHSIQKRLAVVLVLASSARDLMKVLDGVGSWTAGQQRRTDPRRYWESG